MTRISNADQVLLRLHEQLRRLGKDRIARGGAAGVRESRQEPAVRLRALAARGGVSQEELGRTVVRSLLADQFGDTIGNDPAFDVIADDVARIIADSESGRALLDRALAQLTDRSG